MTATTSLEREPSGVRLDRVCVLDGERFAIRNRAAMQVVRWNDVLYLRAAINRTCLVTSSGEVSVRAPITAVTRALESLGCVRIHRGIAVNGGKIVMLIGRGGHGLTVVLENDVRLEVGRRFQRALRARFGAARPSRSPILGSARSTAIE